MCVCVFVQTKKPLKCTPLEEEANHKVRIKLTMDRLPDSFVAVSRRIFSLKDKYVETKPSF